MATLTIAPRSPSRQRAFNLSRWDALQSDAALAKIEGRIETDRHGRIIMTPPPAPRHGTRQARIAGLLLQLMPHGSVLTECPISTADGVKAADVAWASAARMRELGNRTCFPRSPELCVEVRSPGDTQTAIGEKVKLYFDAGAHEVWLCSATGVMTFLNSPSSRPLPPSRLCPAFPRQVEAR
jgi:Uma2 family endonuclease